MCGRFASFRAAQDLADAYDVDEVTEAAGAVTPSYNVAPTQQIRVILDREASPEHPIRRELHAARWGLVPAWATDVRIGNRLINARRESLADKPAFRSSLARRRCVVPAEGYYEWQRRGRTKVPFYIHADDGGPLAFAGLYAFWRDPACADDDPRRWVLSATVITTDAAGDLADIHDRRPVLLTRADVEAWLDPSAHDPVQALAHLSGPVPDLSFHEVSTRVNTPAVDEPDLIAPA